MQPRQQLRQKQLRQAMLGKALNQILAQFLVDVLFLEELSRVMGLLLLVVVGLNFNPPTKNFGKASASQNAR
jgi:hypothetical protein